jgi:hypothetical protein
MAKNDMVEAEISAALDLREQKGALLSQIDDNRKLLRLLDGRGQLNTEESRWLAEFYPVKQYTRGEVEADGAGEFAEAAA